MNKQSQKPIILDQDAPAPTDAYVIRKLSDDHLVLEETGTEFWLTENNTISVRLKSGGVPLKSVPDSLNITDSYVHRTPNGQWLRFTNNDGQLIIT